MERFTTSDGVAIAYEYDASAPAGLPPVVLLHGFAVSGQLNFGGPGLIDALADGDRRTIVIDARGHGESDTPTDPALYGEARMAQDARELLDHLGVERFDLIGYSMGAVVALLIAADPAGARFPGDDSDDSGDAGDVDDSGDARARRIAIGGVGAGIVELGGIDAREMPAHMIVQAMLAPDMAAVEYPLGQAWRAFAETVEADLPALAAQAASMHQGQIALERIVAPTLVIAGDKDGLASRPQVLVDALPEATLELVEADHLAAVRHPRFVPAIVDWLAAD